MRRMWLAFGICIALGVPSLWAATKTTSASSGTSVPAAKGYTAQQRWASQNLSGRISMVDPQKDLIVVRDSTGVPFDIKIERSTRIESGAQREDFAQLSPKESVSVRYTPETSGDIARTIEVQR